MGGVCGRTAGRSGVLVVVVVVCGGLTVVKLGTVWFHGVVEALMVVQGVPLFFRVVGGSTKVETGGMHGEALELVLL